MHDIREMCVENVSYAKLEIKFKRPKIATLTLKPIVCTRQNCSQITCIICQLVATYPSKIVTLVVQNGWDYTLNTQKLCDSNIRT